MKKLFLLSMAAVAMLASCSNDEMVEQTEGAAIGFDAFVNKSTRATDIETGTLANFGVYGFMNSIDGTVFDNEKVYLSGSDWKYDNTQYWTAGKTYYFSAIAPFENANWTYADDTAGGTITFDNKTGEQDLLYAHSEVTCTAPSSQGKVFFTFSHLLSRVKFQFTNGMSNDNIVLEVTDVTVTDAVTTATLDKSNATATWENTGTDGNLVFGGTGKFGRNTSGETNHYYMIPQTDKAYNLTFKVNMYQGSELAQTFSHIVSVPVIEMKQGYSYVFTAQLNKDNISGDTNGDGVVDEKDDKLYPIEFTVNFVDGWKDFDDEDLTVG